MITVWPWLFYQNRGNLKDKFYLRYDCNLDNNFAVITETWKFLLKSSRTKKSRATRSIPIEILLPTQQISNISVAAWGRVASTSPPKEPRPMLVSVYTVLSTILLNSHESKGMKVCFEDEMRLMMVKIERRGHRTKWRYREILTRGRRTKWGCLEILPTGRRNDWVCHKILNRGRRTKWGATKSWAEGVTLSEGATKSWPEDVALSEDATKSWPEGLELIGKAGRF